MGTGVRGAGGEARNGRRCYFALRLATYYCSVVLSSLHGGEVPGVASIRQPRKARGDELTAPRFLPFPPDDKQGLYVRVTVLHEPRKPRRPTRGHKVRAPQPQPRRHIARSSHAPSLPSPRRSFPAPRSVYYMEKGDGGERATLIMVPRTLLRVPGISQAVGRRRGGGKGDCTFCSVLLLGPSPWTAAVSISPDELVLLMGSESTMLCSPACTAQCTVQVKHARSRPARSMSAVLRCRDN